MPKKIIRRFMPDHRKVREHKHLQVFGALLHDPNLWHLNRRSVSGAFAVGLFVAFVPIPLQMVLAAGVAILSRVNLPIAVALVWITNPITIPPMFYSAYKIGAWLTQTPPRSFAIELSMDWMMTELTVIWQPFLLGCFVSGLFSAVVGYLAIRGLWRLHIVSHIRRRRQLKLENKP